MSLSGKDIIVTVSVFAVISGSSYALYKDFTSESKGAQKQIGTITFKKKTAERKFSGRAIWESLSQKSPVYDLDSVRTTEGSSATVNLSDGTVIDLDENTLAILSLSDKGASVDLNSGNIFADNKGSSGLTVKAKGNTVSTRNGALTLSLAKDDLKVRVSSGEASVTSSGGTRDVSGSEAVNLAGGRITSEKVDIILDTPSPSAFIAIPKGSKGDIRFSWKGNAEKGSLFIGKDRLLTKAEKIRVKGVSEIRQLAAGEYFWTVSRDDRVTGEVRKFIVVEDNVIVPISPKDETIPYVGDNPMVPLRWTEAQHVTMYEVELARDRAFRDIVIKKQSRTPVLAVEKLTEGRYYWRVRGVYPDGVASATDNGVSFSLSRTIALQQPELLSPADTERRSVASLKKGLQFAWRPVEGSAEYRVEIARDPRFSQPIFVETKQPGAVVSENLGEGQFFWRVTAISRGVGIKSSEPSKTYSFELTNIVPVSGLATREDPSAKGIIFSWRDDNNFPSYRIEIASSRSFKNLIRKADSTDRKVLITGLPTGEHVWRVIPLDEKGSALSPSQTSTVRIIAKLDPPIPVSPTNNIVLDITHIDRIDFIWKPVTDASDYRFELYKYSLGGDKKLLEADVRGSPFKFNQFTLLSNGTFYWQVRSVKKSGNTIDRMSEPEKGYFTIPAGPSIKAPNVETIKIYVE
jgi:hypothetical protein